MSQLYNFPSIYANGMNVSWLSNTTLEIAAGQVRDPANSFDIELNAPLILNAAGNGVNGLDQGSLAANTFYHVFVIYDETLSQVPATILSLSQTQPLMPFNYTHFRRIGSVKTDGSSNFLKFLRKVSNGNKVFHQWESPINVLTDGAATTFTAFSLAAGSPSSAETVFLNIVYIPTAAASTANIRPTGSAAAAGSCPIVLKSTVDDVAVNLNMIRVLPTTVTGNLSLDYAVTTGDALTIKIAAFLDIL